MSAPRGNIFLAGVGGQGILLASEVLGERCIQWMRLAFSSADVAGSSHTRRTTVRGTGQFSDGTCEPVGVVNSEAKRSKALGWAALRRICSASMHMDWAPRRRRSAP